MGDITIAAKRGTEQVSSIEIDLDGRHVQDILDGDHAGFDSSISAVGAAREDDQIEVEVEPTSGASALVTPRRASTGDLLAIYVQLGRYEVNALEGDGVAEFDDPLRGISVAISGPGES